MLTSFWRNPFRWTWSWLLKRTLQETGPPTTIVRLLTSHHLEDLQWIGHLAVVFWFSWIAGLYWYSQGFSDFIDKKHPYIGGLTAVMGVVLSWIYQTGSSRLGVVDLFACEISAICRVHFVVDVARRSVARAKQEPVDAEDGGPKRFTSEENYTPVYDNVLSELESLNVNVVTFVTEFYTYRKAMVDYLRRIVVEEKAGKKLEELWMMMIYMQFLMYESGRRAISELIEFEPNREESLINALCSELTVFRFLSNLKEIERDFRGRRLKLREKTYQKIVPDIYYATMRVHQSDNWEKAQVTAPVLKRRYEKVFGTMPQRA